MTASKYQPDLTGVTLPTGRALGTFYNKREKVAEGLVKITIYFL